MFWQQSKILQSICHLGAKGKSLQIFSQDGLSNKFSVAKLSSLLLSSPKKTHTILKTFHFLHQGFWGSLAMLDQKPSVWVQCHNSHSLPTPDSLRLSLLADPQLSKLQRMPEIDRWTRQVSETMCQSLNPTINTTADLCNSRSQHCLEFLHNRLLEIYGLNGMRDVQPGAIITRN